MKNNLLLMLSFIATAFGVNLFAETPAVPVDVEMPAEAAPAKDVKLPEAAVTPASQNQVVENGIDLDDASQQFLFGLLSKGKKAKHKKDKDMPEEAAAPATEEPASENSINLDEATEQFLFGLLSKGKKAKHKKDKDMPEEAAAPATEEQPAAENSLDLNDGSVDAAFLSKIIDKVKEVGKKIIKGGKKLLSGGKGAKAEEPAAEEPVAEEAATDNSIDLNDGSVDAAFLSSIVKKVKDVGKKLLSGGKKAPEPTEEMEVE